MDLETLHDRLLAIGVDVPQNTLRRWGYDKRGIIPRPERFKRGTGSKKSGPAASWSEQALYEAAAVWAVLNRSHTAGPPALNLIPHIKSSSRQPYKSVTAGYSISGKLPEKPTYKSVTVHVGYDDPSLGVDPAELQVLRTTWIAAIEKAKRGIRIDTPQQVRFHWKSLKVEKGADYEPEKVNDFDEDNHVSLHESDLGHDEIVIMIDGNDFRKTVARAFEFVKDHQ